MSYIRGVQPVASELKFCGMGKVQILKLALQFLKVIANLPWVANELSVPQSLAHAAVACGPIWLRAFGLAVLHGCTPLPNFRSCNVPPGTCVFYFKN